MSSSASISQIFQSTLPARGATQTMGNALNGSSISTHAPRTGSDASCICVKPFFARFQPTLPARGATDKKFVVKMLVEKVFQPTLPARGATLFIGC